jgi:hypothetical protein
VRDPLKCLQHGFLCHIFSISVVPHQAQSSKKQSPLIGSDEIVEGVRVAFLYAADKCEFGRVLVRV